MAQQDLSPPAAGKFADRRAAARQRAGELQREFAENGETLGWFDALYRAAGEDVAQVPWADLEPHPGLAEWIGKSGFLHEGRALDVGCGLGDNAEALSDAGYDVTAFDISARAVEWARQRFEATRVTYCRADLLDPPAAWRGTFSLVHETYTLQALTGEFRQRAFAAVASLLAPGGKLLLICRSRLDDAVTDGPPWPLSRAELNVFEQLGLTQRCFEEFDVTEDRVIAHFRVLYTAD